MLNWIRSGAPWIWLTGGAVSISLLSVLGLLLLIGWKGLTYFWPAPLYQWNVAALTPVQGEVLHENTILIGQVYERSFVPKSYLPESAAQQLEDDEDFATRLSIKIANRELYPADFISVLQMQLDEPTTPEEWAVIERSSGGYFFGKLVAFQDGDNIYTSDIQSILNKKLDDAETLRHEIDSLVVDQLKELGWKLEQLRLEKRKHELNDTLTESFLKENQTKKEQIEKALATLDLQLDGLRLQLSDYALIAEDMTGSQVSIPLEDILDYWYPNQMSLPDKVMHWGKQVWKFLSEDPRESNSEGGVFPAIFGTVFLVLIMSIIVMPLGVIAAIYLHEYAKNNALTRVIRIAVINLAGVPSIVYGVFGLGFFVYTIGASIDNVFYAEKLPAPTFGTPGLLWSALTLAVLTLPVVIVTTEEGLTRIPSSVRHGSLALGATQFETLWRVVLPMATPAIITGLILAIARAAGEVAPLMLVGVVKLASSLPVDGQFPYVHLDRKFMHLGFHIYDVGFQTSNIEAARPLVYATSFLLVTVIVGLNLTAISIRNNLREKYRTLGQD
ncbi:TPA: phosphate ABC transporter permease PstA [Vibrio alginolyticus]|uniref:Phosphate transport system permease protein PstA n=3 Tax=Vibrionaceae TaxID=641 RepID=A0ABX4XBV6_VIBAL|nr:MULTISPECIES: phosphate ABC transporter permease PstA [Vibrio]AGV18541.1 phosphate ABC transporter, permease protein [Vibrio alginolyticus NBRC 15630 = ATCC 17749]AVF71521.1 phosphate ABC transporter, permease protein PstA [Vibrio alginolyticus]EGR1298120.1 phosphate ABC transporter permease PstA [Vibrio alginolyticus]EJG0027729.1 phosphate ABC transporter permease PstA [Vibrio alginolyticus]EJL6720138.1 phosphate ABC transporter permease PstA [Vibrio alginolyticus]